MRTTWKRLLATVLTALMLTQAAGAETLLPDNQSGIYDSALASITGSAGTFDREFRADRNFYDLILGKDEESFALKVVPHENTPGVRPELRIGELVGEPSVFSEDYLLESGKYSHTYTLAQGEYRSFEIRVITQGAPANYQSYVVRVYRTPNQVTMRRSIHTMPDGSRQLKVEMLATPGVKLQTIILGLKYDTKALKLANKTTNVVLGAAPSYATSIDYAPDLLYGTKAPASTSGMMVQATAGAMKIDNTAGKIEFQLGIDASLAGRPKNYYETTEASGALMTFYFRIMSDTAGVGESSLDFLKNDLFRLGCRVSERAVKQGTTFSSYFAAQGTEYAKFVGTEHVMTLPQRDYAGGEIVVTPEGPAMGTGLGYCYGDTVTLTALPGTGYRFSHWDETGGTALTEAERTSERLYFRLVGDMDISYLRPVFKETEISLPTGAELSFEPPYIGGQIMIFNPLGESGKRPGGSFEDEKMLMADMAEEPASGSVMMVAQESNEDGLERIEIQEDVLLDEGAISPMGISVNEVQEPPQTGDIKEFKARDTRYETAPSVEDGAWTSVPFTLKAVRESAQGSLYVWLAADANWQPMDISDSQIEELADSFIESYTTLTQKYHEVRDSNSNGGLDILLYDIRDNLSSGGGYIGGLINVNELYNSFSSMDKGGNLGDVLHLDTYPQMKTGGSGYMVTQRGLDTAKSTMAHETQHLAMGSVFSSGRDFQNYGPPTWLNEGLSLLMEQELFGVRMDRITYYNSSSAIRNGLDFTLAANWANSNSLSSYSMAYLFFAYISAQAQDPDFMTKFYIPYEGTGIKEVTVESVLRQISVFQDMQLSEIFKRFYLALCLKEPAGIYGFGENTGFQGLNSPMCSTLPSTDLPSGGAVYVESKGSFIPDAVSGLQYVGIRSVKNYNVVAAAEPMDGGNVGVAYLADGVVQVTATPQTGYYFTGWRVDGIDVEDENPMVLMVDKNRSVVATFSTSPVARLTLSFEPALAEAELGAEFVQVLGADNVPIENIAKIPVGTAVTVRYAHSPHCSATFNGWTGTAAPSNPNLTEFSFTMEGDCSLVANVTIDKWALTISNQTPEFGTFAVEDEDGETITPETQGKYMLPPGSKVTLRATANPGYICEGWGTDPAGAQKLTMDKYSDYSIKFRETKPVSISKLIRFQGQTDELIPEVEGNKATYVVAGQGTVVLTPIEGTISDGKEVMESTTLRATAIPAEGRVFHQWVVKNGAVTLNMQEALEQGIIYVVEESRSVLPDEDAFSAARTIEFKVNEKVSLEAQFMDKALGLLRLAKLEVVSPQERKLLKNTDMTPGFKEDVFEYTLSLMSEEQNITLSAVRQAVGVTSAAVLRQLRGGVQVGNEIEIEDRNTDAELPNKLIDLEVRDGDILEILIWDGGVSREVMQTYRIHVEVLTKDREPLIIAMFSQSEPQGAPEKLMLELSADNMQAESIEATILIKKGTVKPVDQDGKEIEFGSATSLDLTKYCLVNASSGYRVSSAMLMRSESGVYDRLILTAERLNPAVPAPIITELSPVLTMRFKKQAGADETWLDGEATGAVFDTKLQKVSPVQILVSDKPMLYGTLNIAGGTAPPIFTIKESGNTDSDSPALVSDIQLTGRGNDGFSQFKFTVMSLELGKSYDITFEKNGYTKVEIIGVTPSLAATDLNAYSDRLSRLEMYAGELDDDNRVTMKDWSLLAYSGLLGRKVSEVDPLYANYDLDDNGIIQMADLELLTKLKCLGKESISITVAPAQR